MNPISEYKQKGPGGPTTFNEKDPVPEFQRIVETIDTLLLNLQEKLNGIDRSVYRIGGEPPKQELPGFTPITNSDSVVDSFRLVISRLEVVDQNAPQSLIRMNF